MGEQRNVNLVSKGNHSSEDRDEAISGHKAISDVEIVSEVELDFKNIFGAAEKNNNLEPDSRIYFLCLGTHGEHSRCIFLQFERWLWGWGCVLVACKDGHLTHFVGICDSF